MKHVSHGHIEDHLVEQPAIGLFATLGRQTVSAMEESFDCGCTLGRETKGEVVPVDRLSAALMALNPGLPAEAIRTAIDELARDRSAVSFEAASRKIYRLFEDGIPVSVPDREHGEQKTDRLRVVDGAQPEQNDFLRVSQISVVGAMADPFALPADYGTLLAEIKTRVRRVGTRAGAAVNAESILLYGWEIGVLIDPCQERKGSGAAAIPRRVRYLHNERPDERGLSERNIKRMPAFHREYPHLRLSSQAVAQMEEDADLPRDSRRGAKWAGVSS